MYNVNDAKKELSEIEKLEESYLQKRKRKQEEIEKSAKQFAGNIKVLSKEYADFTNRNASKMNEIGEKAVSTYSMLTSAISSSFSNLFNNSSKIGDFFGQTADWFNGLSSQFKNLSSDKNGGIGGLIDSLMKFTSKGGIIADVVGAVATIGEAVWSAMEECRKAVAQANLAEHFGNIVLSIQEIESAAEAITTTDWTMKIDAVISAKEKVDELKGDLQTALEEINKLNWKIKVGVELSEEEKENYKLALTNYVSSMISYVEQCHYTVSLSIDAIFSPGTKSNEELKEYVNEVFLKSSTDLQTLGQKMASVVNNALEDGILTESELEEIQGILTRLQEHESKLNKAKEEANLNLITDETLGKGISFESMTQFLTKSNELAKTKISEAYNAYLETLYGIQYSFNEGGMSLDEYNSKNKDVKANFIQKKGQINIEILDIGVGEINSNYSENIAKVEEEWSKAFDYAWTSNKTRSNINRYWESLDDAFFEGAKKMGGDQTAIREYLNALKPQREALEELEAEYRAMGLVPSDSLMESLSEFDRLEMLAGSQAGFWDYLANIIAHSPEKRNAVLQMMESGLEIEEALASSLRSDYGLEIVEEGGSYMWKTVGEIASMNVEDIKKQFSEIGITLPNSLAASLADEDGAVVREMFLLFDQIKSGIEVSAPFMRDTLKIMGIDVTDGLIESILEQEPNVQMGVINMLYGMKGAVDTEKFDILNSMYTYGIEVPNSMMKGMKENYAVLEEGAKGAAYIIDMTTGTAIEEISPSFGKYLTDMGLSGFSSMNSALKNKKLNAPKMKDIDADAYINKTQKSFSGKSVQVTADLKPGSWWSKLFGSLNARATGGIVESPEIALIGEAGPESIIPLSSSKRTRALELYTQTSEALGVDEQITRAAVMSSVSGSRAAMAFLAAGPVPSENRVEINYKKLAQELYGALSASPIQVKPSFTVTGGDIYLDTTKAGKALAPHIDAELGRINHRKERGI